MVDAIFRVWSTFYDNPVQQRLYFRPIQEAARKALGDTPGRVLDLGCGTGELTAQLPNSIGADLSLGMLKRAWQKPTLAGRLVVADGHSLPLADASVDAVTCLISFQYYLRPLQALREMRRVTAPGGCVILGALTSSALQVQAISNAMRVATGGMFRVYAPTELHDLFVEAGFAGVEHRLIRPFTRLFVAPVS
ncbi:MAG: ubiquinone/menaquinone biosynthesis C-methylase UbiE [Myxococcota bacterium]|jgi:ubiquinone/menaquinone biosynthesis C-methylase UbiE